ncbi:hypothetical protein SAMN05216371_8175 [Streptomyces sp. TLI_053]|uniref:hypothetical protein n=1 Tax=Streptomyces sp. TLI_053 TaxID=1855352 RepID=UPI00087D3A4D|nr:hypothetical protein [Streptomyces sp. TLI_053]SDT83354.1 hypothetical protein SAMN05216371_8175 [Streptomyces sp. TLI_053]
MRLLPWLPAAKDPVDDLAVVKALTGAALLRTTWHLPPGDVLEREAVVLERLGHTSAKRLSARQYEALRAVALASLAGWTLGCDHWAVRVLANASSLAVHGQNAALLPESWNYASHLHFFLVLLTLFPVGERTTPDSAAVLLEALQLCYAWAYLQAGASKLRNTGVRWADGRTLRASWAESRSPLGEWLGRRDLRWASAASTAALVLELGFVPALLVPGPHRRLLGLASLAFHGSTKATLGISFWHFSWYAVPLFGLPESVSGPVARLAAHARRVATSRPCANSDSVRMRLMC